MAKNLIQLQKPEVANNVLEIVIVHVYSPSDYYTAADRRSLPEIPLTTRSSQHHPTFQTSSSTPFDDDGHYSDIHWNVGGDGALRIPTWRQSFDDEPGHYNVPEVYQVSEADNNTEERPQRSNGGYQGLDPTVLTSLRQPSAPHEYAGIRSVQPRSTVGQRPHSCPGIDNSSVTVVEELRRTPRPHSHAGDVISSPTGRSSVHSYLELIDDPEITAEGYEGLDPVAVQEARLRANQPRVYAGLTESNDGYRQAM